jgi:signal transduction histidine kinase
MAHKPDTGSAVAATDRALAHAATLFRIGGLLEVVLILCVGLAAGHPGARSASLLAAAIVAEGTAFCIACVRRGRLKPLWATADLLFIVAVLIVEGVSESGYKHWVGFAFSFSIIASVAFGITLRQLRSVGLGTAMLALGFFIDATLRHSEPLPNVIIDMVTYAPNTLVAWMVSKRMRSTGQELDERRAQVAELAAEKERTRHVRILHDHVLQTLESLVQQDAISCRELSHAVAADAAWLRALVEGTLSDRQNDLLWRLQELVRRHARTGLRVEFNAQQLLRSGDARACLPDAVSEAVTEAVGEALTNTAKHACTDTAVLCAVLTEEALIVSVLDHGVGFDAGCTRQGVGLRQSIHGRIEEIGGHVQIDSSHGEGTYVEITVQSAAWHSG